MHITRFFRVVCLKCMASSGLYDTEQSAIDAWDLRTDGWIPVSELPKKIDHYLVNRAGHPVSILWFDGKCFSYNSGVGAYGVTHWKPLPQPPKGAHSNANVKRTDCDGIQTSDVSEPAKEDPR